MTDTIAQPTSGAPTRATVLLDRPWLRLRGPVSGELRRDASAAEMIIGVVELIAYCSLDLTLDPGDVIATGTWAGLGWWGKLQIAADADLSADGGAAGCRPLPVTHARSGAHCPA